MAGYAIEMVLVALITAAQGPVEPEARLDGPSADQVVSLLSQGLPGRVQGKVKVSFHGSERWSKRRYIAMLEGRFSKAKFGGQAEFSISAFQKKANILQAVFSDGADLAEARFNGAFQLGMAKFQSLSDFTKASFVWEGPAST
jgi:hypothetical protein